ncbi:MAG: glycosyltransferase [Clostridiales bacterium]|nr:glycosyltransferase [Clostridiales bacterium]
MKILIVNPIIYTSETRNIKKANTIKDTMIYDLCLAFQNLDNEVVLAAAEDFQPVNHESYPFSVVWMKTKLKKICPPNVLPYCPEIKNIAKKGNFDMIITSEVFSLNSLMLVIRSKKNVIIWHELAKHNKIFGGIPSRIWYNFVARIFYRNALIVPRSSEAKTFISQYCNNVNDTVIDHGVNLDKFTLFTNKDNCFVVSSQLIKRKRINKIITTFADYLKLYDNNTNLYIIGDGDEKNNLENLVKSLNIQNNVHFTGKLNHNELIKYLQQAMAMLVYTEKDNNMVSIVEAIAVGTPIITTSIPYNASYIKANELGIVNDNWNAQDLYKIAGDDKFIKNCISYRNTVSTKNKAETFLNLFINRR